MDRCPHCHHIDENMLVRGYCKHCHEDVVSTPAGPAVSGALKRHQEDKTPVRVIGLGIACLALIFLFPLAGVASGILSVVCGLVGLFGLALLATGKMPSEWAK